MNDYRLVNYPHLADVSIKDSTAAARLDEPTRCGYPRVGPSNLENTKERLYSGLCDSEPYSTEPSVDFSPHTVHNSRLGRPH